MLDRMLSFYSVKILLSTSIKILLPTLNKFSTCDSFIHKTYQIVGSLSPLISNKSTTSTFRKELKIFLDCLFPLLSDKNARSYAALLSVKILLTTSTKKTTAYFKQMFTNLPTLLFSKHIKLLDRSSPLLSDKSNIS
jgi:hypothetical protein